MRGKEQLGVRMLSYSTPKDSANISFISPKGDVKTVYIHRVTFNKLVTGALDKEEGMTPTLEQMELREALNKEVGGDLVKWFTTTSNELRYGEANAKHPYPQN